MRTFLNIIFVYIPFVICILFQVILLMMLYQEEGDGLAGAAKIVFPSAFIVAVLLHHTKLLKK